MFLVFCVIISFFFLFWFLEENASIPGKTSRENYSLLFRLHKHLCGKPRFKMISWFVLLGNVLLNWRQLDETTFGGKKKISIVGKSRTLYQFCKEITPLRWFNNNFLIFFVRNRKPLKIAKKSKENCIIMEDIGVVSFFCLLLLLVLYSQI